MTVLQQVKDYCHRYAHPSAALVKDVMQKIVTPDGTVSSAAQDSNTVATVSPAVAPPDNRGRFISKEI